MVGIEYSLVLIKLLLARIATEFLLQPASWLKEKSIYGIFSWAFFKHIALTTCVTALVTWQNPLILLGSAVFHSLIDLWKIQSDKKGILGYLIVKHILHLLVVLLTWLMIVDGWLTFYTWVSQLWSSYDFLIVLLGYLFCIGPASAIIKFGTHNLIDQEKDHHIKRGGRVIGISERIIIITFVLFSQYEAIGFLITGKSILRFAEGQKKETEYVLVGTMMSYALAILAGVMVNKFR